MELLFAVILLGPCGGSVICAAKGAGLAAVALGAPPVAFGVWAR